MKTFAKHIALILAVIMLTAALAACGDSKDSTPAAEDATTANDATVADDATVEQTEADATEAGDYEEVSGVSAVWGAYSVLVPEGFELVEAGEFSSYDFAVKKSDFSYFDFNTEADDDIMMQHYNYNKSAYTLEQEDFDMVFDENEWIGFTYSDGYGGVGFEAYSTIDGKIVRVSSAGFPIRSAVASAVMSSFTKLSDDES